MTQDPFTADLDVYLVGGAVRDEILGRPVRDRDWVVVGNGVEDMLKRGFAQVGRDFPVFLHPVSHEEYALARTERKSGTGHTAFSISADPSVTLEEDLKRRDLTVNAIARGPDGALRDPFDGQKDIERRLLRHVSPAFAEDPLRVFRVARFAAQLPGFEVAPETLELMKQMAVSGELESLSAERVWLELERALSGVQPERFAEVLRACGALSQWLDELLDEDLQWTSPGADADAEGQALVCFARLHLPADAAERLCRRLRAPKAYEEAAKDMARYAPPVMAWRDASPELLLQALEGLRAMQDDSRLKTLVGNIWYGNVAARREAEALLRIVGQIRALKFDVGQVQGAAYGAALREARVVWLGAALVEANDEF